MGKCDAETVESYEKFFDFETLPKEDELKLAKSISCYKVNYKSNKASSFLLIFQTPFVFNLRTKSRTGYQLTSAPSLI